MAAISHSLKTALENKGVDIDMTITLLDRINSGAFDNLAPVQMESLPHIDGSTIIDAVDTLSLTIQYTRLQEVLADYTIDTSDAPAVSEAIIEAEHSGSSDVHLNNNCLYEIGILLTPLTAYGVLNGGSATSYCDTKKNRGFHAQVFDAVATEFSSIAKQAAARPKGLTPAFINPDGSPGPSFLELKMRSLLLLAREYQRQTGMGPEAAVGPVPAAPMFQMSSVFTHDELMQAYKEFKKSPLLSGLIAETGIDITSVLDAVQPLLAAFTHSEAGRPKAIFTSAYGKSNSPVAVPGGHGQNFQVLSDTYRSLYNSGKRFAYIGNVDNLGFTVDPPTLAYFALSGRPAAFDFAFKTPVDVKGGVLVRQSDGSLTCGDIGPAVSKEDLAAAEKSGTPILFNAATGLFRLDHLVERLDDIINNLPVRISDQDKDPGRYSQAEQVTWEVIGMLDNPLILGISKYRRFLAAKLLIETMITSGRVPEESFEGSAELKAEAQRLNAGLHELLTDTYGLKLKDGKYQP